MLTDFALRLRNVTADLAGAIPLVNAAFRRRSHQSLIFDSKSPREEDSAYRARRAREYARFHCASLTISHDSPTQLTFTFLDGGRNVAFGATFFARYLKLACNGAYGREGAPIRLDSSVWIHANSKFDPELIAAMGLAPGVESPIDVLMQGNSKPGSSRLPEANAITLLSEGQLPDGRTPPKVLAQAALKLAPGSQCVAFEMLEDTIQRKAELELRFPLIQIVLSGDEREITHLAARVSLDLNRPVKRLVRSATERRLD